MIQLFNGMQSSLSMVYDREMGNMRTLLVSPFPRWYLLSSKLIAGTAVSLLQVYAFLLIAWFWEIQPPPVGYLTVLPALVLTGLMLGALGMLISSVITQLENFAGVMNFVIFRCSSHRRRSIRCGAFRKEARPSTTSAWPILSPTQPNSSASHSTGRSTGFRWRWFAVVRGCSWSAPSWPMTRHAACWRVGAASAPLPKFVIHCGTF
jgi:ABC-type multidrug transport system, permease component